MALFGSKGTQATSDELYALARAAGFGQQDAVTATALALAETRGSGQTNSWNPTAPDDSYGPWQINRLAHGDRLGTPDQLVDPLTNAQAAHTLYAGRGGWGDWSTFNDGTYQRYVKEAAASALQVSDAQIAGLVAGVRERAGFAASSASSPLGDAVTAVGNAAAGIVSAVGGAQAAGLPGVAAMQQSNVDQQNAGAAQLQGDVAGAVGGVQAAVGGAVHSAASGLDAIGQAAGQLGGILTWWQQPGHQWAVLLLALGGGLVLLGLLVYLRPETAAVQAVAGAVARVAL